MEVTLAIHVNDEMLLEQDSCVGSVMDSTVKEEVLTLRISRLGFEGYKVMVVFPSKSKANVVC